MRIAIVQDHLRLGGTESQSVALANAFAAAAHTVLLLTFRPGGALEARIDNRVRHVSLQRRDFELDWFAPRLIATLREFAPEAIQTMGRMANAHGWRIIRALPEAKVIATFRTGKAIPGWYVRTLREAAAVVCNSNDAVRRLATTHRISGDRVHIIRNALMQPPIAPDAHARSLVRAEVGTPHDAVVFLCVAMMRPGKGHRQLVETVARLDPHEPWELWLAGEGTERDTADALAHKLGLGHRVRFLGQRSDTNRLYAAADVAVLASRVESLPNFLVEAQWNGLPVAAWDTAGVGESFVANESGILVAVGDQAGLAAAMQRLAGDLSLRSSMAERASAFARAEFDPVRQNQRYLELYAAITA